MNPDQIKKMQEGRKNHKGKGKTISNENIVMDDKRKYFFNQIDEDCPSRKKIFIKAYKGSLRAAVNANCLACVWFDVPAIRDCKSTICGLWAVRPYQKKEKVQ